MSWQKVAIVFIMVAGAVTAAVLGQKELGLILAGAAAGFAQSEPKQLHAESSRKEG